MEFVELPARAEALPS